jgi:hypothetical protein
VVELAVGEAVVDGAADQAPAHRAVEADGEAGAVGVEIGLGRPVMELALVVGRGEQVEAFERHGIGRRAARLHAAAVPVGLALGLAHALLDRGWQAALLHLDLAADAAGGADAGAAGTAAAADIREQHRIDLVLEALGVRRLDEGHGHGRGGADAGQCGDSDGGALMRPAAAGNRNVARHIRHV